MGKVFLSYSRADSLDFARQLHRRLVRDCIDCFFDEASIEWGDNFVLALENGLNESDHVIVVLSPGFVGSEWTSAERTSSTVDDPANLKHTFLPLLYLPCEPPRFLKPIQYLDVSTDELFDEHYPTISKKLSGAFQEAVKPNTLNLGESGTSVLPCYEWPESPLSLVWPIADHSKARESFSQLLTRDTTQRLLTLSGPSGSGKSSITRQMLGNALQIPDLACGLFDFKGITDKDDNELRAFVQHLDVPFPSAIPSSNGKFHTILEALKSRSKPTLLIFDTYETVGEAQKWVEGQLLSFLIRAPWLRVAISGQQVPKYNGAIWQLNAFPPIALEDPLPDDWFKYSQLYRTDLTLSDVKQVCDVTNKAELLAQIFGSQA